MGTLFRDEKTDLSPELLAKIDRMSKDFPSEVKELQHSIQAIAILAGIANTRLLVNSLLDRAETLADIRA